MYNEMLSILSVREIQIKTALRCKFYLLDWQSKRGTGHYISSAVGKESGRWIEPDSALLLGRTVWQYLLRL